MRLGDARTLSEVATNVAIVSRGPQAGGLYDIAAVEARSASEAFTCCRRVCGQAPRTSPSGTAIQQATREPSRDRLPLLTT